MACWPAGVREPRRAEASAWSVTPFARSTTSAGRSGKRRPATHCASRRLSDAMIGGWGLSPELEALMPGGVGPGAHGCHAHVEHVGLPGRDGVHTAAERRLQLPGLANGSALDPLGLRQHDEVDLG